MEPIRPILKLLECATTLIGDRDPEAVARELFEGFPFDDARMCHRLEQNMGAVRLFRDLQALWREKRQEASGAPCP